MRGPIRKRALVATTRDDWMKESDTRASRAPEPTGSGLHRYQATKLDLADVVRNAMDLARERGDERSHGAGRDLLARLASDRFDLAVLGQFSRGKSSLMNAVVGHAYLPTGARPTTSVVTTVRFGDRPRALVHRRDGVMPIETSINDLAAYVTTVSQQENSSEVTRVDVELPAEILRLGFNFVDTPGVGSAIVANTATTETFLPQADAVILVTSVDSPLTDVELQFLKKTVGYGAKLFLTVNKVDLLTPVEVEAALDFVKGEMRKVPGLDDLRVFPLSAKLGLEAKEASDSSRLKSSGLAAFEAALVDFLTHQKATEFLRRTCDRAENLVAHQRLYAELATQAAEEAADHNDRLTRFLQQVDQIVAAEKLALNRLKDAVKSEMSVRITAEAQSWAEELNQLLLPEFDLLWLPGKGTRSADVARTLTEIGSREFEEWERRRAYAALRSVNELFADGIGQLDDFQHLVASAAAEVFGIYPPPAPSSDRSEAGLPSLVSRPVAWAFAIRPPWWRQLAQGPRLAATVRSLARGQLQRSIESYCREVAEHLMLDVNDWVETLAGQMEAATQASVDQLTQVVGVRDPRQDVARLDQISQRLSEIRTEVSEWYVGPAEETPNVPRASVFAVPGGVRQPSRWRCVVCSSLARAQFDHLRQSQYDLATHPDQQAEHAARGGFCPFHTWIYSDVASPVGIAAGYARLAGSVGEALRALNRSAQDLKDLAAGVARLTQTSDRCQACRALMDVQREAVAAVIAALEKKSTDALRNSLCLPHVLAVLEAGPSAEAGHRLVAELAQSILQRSEDMRIYVLKRQSLRRELLSDDEEKAAMESLVILAGRPDLARRFSGPTEISVR